MAPTPINIVNGERILFACFTCADKGYPNVASAIGTPDVVDRVNQALEKVSSEHSGHDVRPIRKIVSNVIMKVAVEDSLDQINRSPFNVYVHGHRVTK